MKHEDCGDCYGRGFIINGGAPYGCPRCNGTGIAANYKWLGVLIVGVVAAIVVGLGVWLLT